MVVIVAAGVSLIAYSRNENLHPKTVATKAPVGPNASDHWQAAYAIDICGEIEPSLPANSNLSKVGIRTYGNGLIDMDPSAVSTDEAAYEGAKVTVGLFAKSYPKFTLTSTSIQLPGKSELKDGDVCSGGKLTGVGTLELWTWSSPNAKKGHLFTGNLTTYHLTNGAMVTIAFVPKGSTVPEPPSRTALVAALGSAT